MQIFCDRLVKVFRIVMHCKMLGSCACIVALRFRRAKQRSFIYIKIGMRPRHEACGTPEVIAVLRNAARTLHNFKENFMIYRIKVVSLSW